MSDQSREFQERLLEIFRVEAREHVDDMSALLLQLESPDAKNTRLEKLEYLFREAHSLKGAARAVNFAGIEKLCQVLESLLARLKRQELDLSPPLVDVLYQTVDQLTAMLESPGMQGPPAELIRRLQQPTDISPATRRNETKTTHSEPMPDPVDARPDPIDVGSVNVETVTMGAPVHRPTSETLRVSKAKLDALLNDTEELLAEQQLFTHLVHELRTLCIEIAAWDQQLQKNARPARSLLQDLEKHTTAKHRAKDATLCQLLEELACGETAVKSLVGRSSRLLKAAEQDRKTFASLSANLQDKVKHLLMLPFSSLSDALPKMARTLARERNKSAVMTIEGAELEVDRRILEEIKDPLIHLLRNCVDHGIETPEERRRLNKPDQGKISLVITPRSSDKVEITLSDDGAGINVAKLRTRASELGLLPANGNAPSDQELLPLIFESGVTTSTFITDLSGRGLGLAIVREKVEKLGGSVTVETRAGQGSQFRLRLPSTLAGVRGVLIRVGDALFVLPSAHVERTLRVQPEAIQTVENRETILMDGTTLALVSLNDILQLSRRKSPAGPLLPVVVVAIAGMRIALGVDEIIDETEILAKKLRPPLLTVRYVSGATLIAGGKVVPILNVGNLVKAAGKIGSALPVREVAAEAAAPESRRVLVVEDSITTRTLLRNILETAGYEVRTAVDGIDAYTLLRSETFHLVISDVDMPRMNGFDLTQRIRQDSKLAELPVVLVTALESREDRERGIDVGANAYIVKRSFDQSNLLDAIRRLI